MQAKIYRIEYQLSLPDSYSTDLDQARDYLRKSGYIQQSVLERNKENFLYEEYWEGNKPGVLKAKIVEVECINEINLDETLHSVPMCINESCAWNLKQFCKLPGLCPGRNKR